MPKNWIIELFHNYYNYNKLVLYPCLKIELLNCWPTFWQLTDLCTEKLKSMIQPLITYDILTKPLETRITLFSLLTIGHSQHFLLFFWSYPNDLSIELHTNLANPTFSILIKLLFLSIHSFFSLNWHWKMYKDHRLLHVILSCSFTLLLNCETCLIVFFVNCRVWYFVQFILLSNYDYTSHPTTTLPHGKNDT